MKVESRPDFPPAILIPALHLSTGYACLRPGVGDIRPAVATENETREETERRLETLAREFGKTHNRQLLSEIAELAERLGLLRGVADG